MTLPIAVAIAVAAKCCCCQMLLLLMLPMMILVVVAMCVHESGVHVAFGHPDRSHLTSRNETTIKTTKQCAHEKKEKKTLKRALWLEIYTIKRRLSHSFE